MSDIDLAAADHLLTTTKQVRKRLDLTRPVPRELLLECIDIASHAPMGGNRERNRWMVVDDPDLKAAIAEPYQAIGRPYLAANEGVDADERQQRVVDSAAFLVDHIAEVPAMVIAIRLDRLPDGRPQRRGGRLPRLGGARRVELPAGRPRPRPRARRGRRSTCSTSSRWPSCSASRTPSRRSRCSRSPTTPATRSHPAPRRPAREITYFNRWKQTI